MPDVDIVEPRDVLPQMFRGRSRFDCAFSLYEGSSYDPVVICHAEATIAHFLSRHTCATDDPICCRYE